MYFNYRLFFRAQRLALFRKPTLRRWAYVLFFTGLYWIMWLIVAAGRLLDHLLFPSFRQQQVHAPVFIIAPPRSGTTLLQKLMSMDEERFVPTKLYQAIFPSIAIQKGIRAFSGFDLRCGGLVHKLLHWAERRWFGAWDDLHPMRLNEPEEDDGFFVYTFVTEAIYLLFPFVDELWEAGFADALPPDERRKLMEYYRSCLQRQLYVNGPEKTILSKATQLSGAVQCLMEEFPDAKFITIVRHPYQSVASHVSLFYPAWTAHSPEVGRDSAVCKAYGGLALQWYRHLFELRSMIPEGQYFCVQYADLVGAPVDVVENAYRYFEFGLTDEFHARLEAATQRQREFKSLHRYSLEEFGLSREWIQAEIGDILDAYCLQR